MAQEPSRARMGLRRGLGSAETEVLEVRAAGMRVGVGLANAWIAIAASEAKVEARTVALQAPGRTLLA